MAMERSMMMARLSSRYSVSQGGGSRLLEDVAFFVGLLFIAAKSGVEIAQEIGLVASTQHTLTTVLIEFMRSSLLVAPKLLGRATAGRVWGSLGAGAGKRLGGGNGPD